MVFITVSYGSYGLLLRKARWFYKGIFFTLKILSLIGLEIPAFVENQPKSVSIFSYRIFRNVTNIADFYNEKITDNYGAYCLPPLLKSSCFGQKPQSVALKWVLLIAGRWGLHPPMCLQTAKIN